MKYNTPGAELLKAWLQDKNLTQAALADLLEVQPSAVANWACGWARPDDVTRVVLEDLSGISQDRWLTKEEWAKLRNLLGKVRLWRDDHAETVPKQGGKRSRRKIQRGSK